MRVIYLIDPPATLNAHSDSTIELMRAQQRAGDDVFFALANQMSLVSGHLEIIAQPVQLNDDDRNWFNVRGNYQNLTIADIDLIFMRLEPPVGSAYRTVCQMLMFAQRAGVSVVNDPATLITGEEKLNALRFPQLCPRTLVSNDRVRIIEFVATLEGGSMIKPLGGFGGQSVFSFAANDSNLEVAVDSLLANGHSVLAQERLREISEGDRRVLVIEGEPFAYMINRIPSAGSHLGNMGAGGIGTAKQLGEPEKSIVAAIGSHLRDAGILFAGIDIIGGKLTEINITCPTGLRVVRDQTNSDPAARIIEAAKKISA